MRSLRARGWAPGARVAPAVVAFALFGLLSMHGWGTHAGVHPAGAAPAPLSPAAAPHDHHGDSAMTGAAAPGADVRVDRTGHGDHGPGGHVGGGLLGLCLAVLAGLALGVVLARWGSGAWTPPSLRPLFRRPVLLERDRDPPGPLRFCVIRC